MEYKQLDDLVMKRYKRKGLYNRVTKVKNDLGEIVFLWFQTEIGWENTEGLIDGLIVGGNGHQYLTPERDEVLIKLYRAT